MEEKGAVVARFDANRSCTFSANECKVSKGFFDLGIDFLKYNLENLQSEEIVCNYPMDVIERMREKCLGQLRRFEEAKDIAPDSID